MEHRRKSDLSNYWINRAEALRDSALILYDKSPQFGLQDPQYMLAGLAIEVIVKAILVKQHQRFDDKKFSHHKINQLIKAAGIKISEDQNAMIGILEEAIYWLGKYPDPNNFKEYDAKVDRLDKVVKKVSDRLSITTADEKRWPDRENFLDLWHYLMGIYIDTRTENPNEFGYKLRGIEC